MRTQLATLTNAIADVFDNPLYQPHDQAATYDALAAQAASYQHLQQSHQHQPADLAALVLIIAILYAAGSLLGLGQTDTVADVSDMMIKSRSKSLKPVTWLTADLRNGLPTIDELRSQCFLVGTTPPEGDDAYGFHNFICVEANINAAEDFVVCEPSPTFSQYYQHPIVVCRKAALYK